MVSFSQIVKYLNIGKGRKTTTAENVDTNREKYDHIISARRITKIHKVLVIPQYIDQNWPGFPHNSILAQYNFYHDVPFRLTNIELLRDGNYGTTGKHLESSFLTVKWRVNTAVYRYHLFGTRQEDNNGNLIVTLFPLYAGELIPNYCVFELWQGIAPIGYSQHGIISDITLETNILVDPEDVDQTQVLLTDPTEYTRDELTHAIGEGPWPNEDEQGMINQAYQTN